MALCEVIHAGTILAGWRLAPYHAETRGSAPPVALRAVVHAGNNLVARLRRRRVALRAVVHAGNNLVARLRRRVALRAVVHAGNNLRERHRFAPWFTLETI